LLFQLCKFSSCDTYFAEANKIYQLAYEDAHPKKGLLLLYSANVMQFHGHYAEANENYKRAADMMHQTTGDSSLFSAMVLLGQAKCAKDQGIYQLSVSLVDQAIFIPMQGMVQSLNVSVATATLLFEAVRQRQAAGLLPQHGEGLPPELYNKLLFEWAYPQVAAWCRREGRPYPALDGEGAISEELPRNLRLRC
jgi:tRNA(Leu) C34 or U34 (ribose-2'-O)-methylase TrmL